MAVGRPSLKQSEKQSLVSFLNHRDDLYREKSLCLVPDWSVLMQMRIPNPQNLISLKSTVPLGWNGAALIGRLIC